MTVPCPARRPAQRNRSLRCALALAGVLVSTAMLSGCGQKGPLYLPDAAGSVVTRPTQTPQSAPPATTLPATASPAAATATVPQTTADPEAVPQNDAEKKSTEPSSQRKQR